MDLLGPCTNVFLTAYAHVRTEPQSDIGQTRGKKILVSEASTKIKAGLVIILASGHESPIAEADPADPTRDPDEIAALVVKAYHEHVEGYLATTRPPHNTEEAVSSGLLGSPLLGTQTRAAADWCHAWSLLGQWSGWVTFPVPETGEWPRHGHLRGILDGYQGISGPTGVRTRSSPNPQPSPGEVVRQTIRNTYETLNPI